MSVGVVVKKGASAPPAGHCKNSSNSLLLLFCFVFSTLVAATEIFVAILRFSAILGVLELQILISPATHCFSYLASEHMDPEDLGVVVALGEGEAVALRRAVVAAHTEQDLVDWVVGDLQVGVGVQESVWKKNITDVDFLFFFVHKFLQWQAFPAPPSYLTVPSDTPGTDSVTSRGTWHCPRRMLIMRSASTSLRGALTEAQPR